MVHMFQTVRGRGWWVLPHLVAALCILFGAIYTGNLTAVRYFRPNAVFFMVRRTPNRSSCAVKPYLDHVAPCALTSTSAHCHSCAMLSRIGPVSSRVRLRGIGGAAHSSPIKRVSSQSRRRISVTSYLRWCRLQIQAAGLR